MHHSAGLIIRITVRSRSSEADVSSGVGRQSLDYGWGFRPQSRASLIDPAATVVVGSSLHHPVVQTFPTRIVRQRQLLAKPDAWLSEVPTPAGAVLRRSSAQTHAQLLVGCGQTFPIVLVGLDALLQPLDRPVPGRQSAQVVDRAIGVIPVLALQGRAPGPSAVRFRFGGAG